MTARVSNTPDTPRTAHAKSHDTWLERDCIRLCIANLEYRARQGVRVEVSDRFALVVAKHLRRLLPAGDQ